MPRPSISRKEPMALEAAMGRRDSPDFQRLLTPSSTFHQDGLLPTPLSPVSSYDDRFLFACPAKPQKPSWYKRIPYFILTISLIEITTYLFIQDEFYNSLKFNQKCNWQIWRYISYMLMHTDKWHLIMNIIVQLIVAVPLEINQGSWRVCPVYITGVISGALVAYIFQSNASVVGASAGIYALLISYVADITYNFTMKYSNTKIVCISFLISADVSYNFYHQLRENEMSPSISWSAHLGGAVAGLVIGFIVYHGEYRKEKFARAIIYTCYVMGAIFFTTIILFNVLCVHVTSVNTINMNENQ